MTSVNIDIKSDVICIRVTAFMPLIRAEKRKEMKPYRWTRRRRSYVGNRETPQLIHETELREREALIGQSLATAQPKFSAICCHMQMWLGDGRGRGGGTRGREDQASSSGRLLCRTEMERYRRSLERSVAQCKAVHNNELICRGGVRKGGLISLLQYNVHATLGGPLWFGGLRRS